MARSPAPPFYAVHAEALAADHNAAPPLAHEPGHAGSVEDWQQALDLAEVVVHLEEEEQAPAPPDPSFADTEAVVVDASCTPLEARRAL